MMMVVVVVVIETNYFSYFRIIYSIYIYENSVNIVWWFKNEKQDTYIDKPNHPPPTNTHPHKHVVSLSPMSRKVRSSLKATRGKVHCGCSVKTWEQSEFVDVVLGTLYIWENNLGGVFLHPVQQTSRHVCQNLIPSWNLGSGNLQPEVSPETCWLAFVDSTNCNMRNIPSSPQLLP